MADGPPMSSPYVWEAPDNFERVIRITLAFNDTTRALTDAVLYRDAGCQWTKIYVGVGEGGSPNRTDKVFTVPEGESTFPSQSLRQIGLRTIEDILSVQITAGP